MPRRRKHFIDELADDLREDIVLFKEDIIEAFSDVAPIGGVQRLPPIKDRVQSYLEMSPQQRQQMFMELGPDGYKEFVQQAMTDLVSVYGANASGAMSWFMGVGPEQPQAPQQTEIDMVTMLGTPVPEEGV